MWLDDMLLLINISVSTGNSGCGDFAVVKSLITMDSSNLHIYADISK